MRTIIGGICLLLMCGSAFGESIPGDINGDGQVNFSDFLILATNFGKIGDPPRPDTLRVTIYDTTRITLRDTIQTATNDTTKVTVIVAETREPASDQEIPRLATITASGSWRNWDADIEDDGIALTIFTKDALGDLIFSFDIPSTIQLTVEAKLYTDNNRDSKPDIPAVYSGKFIGTVADFLSASISVARIPREQIGIDSTKDSQLGILDVTLTTPHQGSFSYRNPITRLYP